MWGKNLKRELQMKQIIQLLITTVLLTLISCASPANTALMDKGDRAMWQGRLADAAANYEKAIQQHPGDWEAQYNLGKCYLEMGEPLKASHSLSIAETIQPTNTEIADLLATALLECGEHDRLFSFLQSRAKKAQTARSWIKFAECAISLDDPDSATVAINTAISVSGGQDATPYIVAAMIADRVGNNDVATKRWREAWHINPNDQQVSDALRSLGVVPGPTMTGIPPE